ncbi:MAG: hypothetical protein M1491_07660 [Deltaproteobacteria bacterium]|nr:hypothetical protein [Deltaproteobacteria bacterium]MCL5276812.1 hypothetical protein [Deltaproteobacteria bacterium]
MNIKLVYAVTITSMLIAPNAMAKDLTQRLGVGFNSQMGVTQRLDAASVRYWMDQDMAIQGDLAFLSLSPINDSGQTALGIGGKFLYNLVEEENMSLYAGGGIYVFDQPVDTSTGIRMKAGFSIGALGGMEFFFQGLPNLGFNVEIDLGVKHLDGYGTTFGISADSIDAGVHYYL